MGESRGFYERNDADDATSLVSGRSCKCGYTAVCDYVAGRARASAKEPMLHDTFPSIDVTGAREGLV